MKHFFREYAETIIEFFLMMIFTTVLLEVLNIIYGMNL